MTLLKLSNIEKKYKTKILLKEVNLEIKKKDFIIIMGESGIGKSTLLNIMYGIEKIDSGKIIGDFNNISYITQDYALIENESVKKNLFYVCKNVEKIKEALKKVNLMEEILSKKVYKLSGGEKQRVAIARAFLQDKEIILCDEPTGNLDAENTLSVMNLITNLNESGQTVVMVTHDKELKKYATRILELKNKELIEK